MSSERLMGMSMWCTSQTVWNSFLQGRTYSDRYDNASATWVVLCAILMFFMVSCVDPYFFAYSYVSCCASIANYIYFVINTC